MNGFQQAAQYLIDTICNLKKHYAKRVLDGSNTNPFRSKVAFGVGMLANQMFPAALGIFMVILVQSLGMSPFLWGLIFFLPKLVDCVTDPIMGFISDRTVSRWGKRRPYVFIGAILSGLSYMAMWQLSADNSQLYNFVYFLCWSSVFFIGLTIFSVPYVAMGYEMSDDYHERTRLMAVAQWIGQWAWVIAPWFGSFSTTSTGLIAPPRAPGRCQSGWAASACSLQWYRRFLLRDFRDRPETEAPASDQSVGPTLSELLRGITVILRCPPFQQICIATFCIFNSYNTVAGFAWFIIVYFMNQGDPALAVAHLIWQHLGTLHLSS